MAKTQYLTFFIVLTDPAVVAAEQAFWPEGVPSSPLDAATYFGATFVGYSDPGAGAPYVWTPWSGIGTEDGPFPLTHKTFTRKSGGFWGIGGSTTKFYWIGKVVLAAGATDPPYVPPGPNAPAPVPTGAAAAPATPEKVSLMPRRWVEGFEIEHGAGHSSGNSFFNVDASRLPGGWGLAVRQNTSGWSILHTALDYGAVAQASGWERIYVRIRKLPTAAGRFWWQRGSLSSTAATALEVLPSGQIQVSHMDIAVGASEVQPLDEWIKCDVLYEYISGGGRIRFYLNGRQVLDVTTNNTGLGQAGALHSQSSAGSGASVNGGEWDLDDWICADIPTELDSAELWIEGTDYVVDDLVLYDGTVYRCTLNHTADVDAQNQPPNGLYWVQRNSHDFAMGSHVARVVPTGFGATHSVNWAGDWRNLLHRPGLSNAAANEVASTTASALLAVTTDYEQVKASFPGCLGAAAFAVGMYGARAGTAANDGRVGYIKKTGEAAVLTAVVQAVSTFWESALYAGGNPDGAEDLTGLELLYEKGATADSSTVKALAAGVEFLGIFDQCDQVPVAEGETQPAYAHGPGPLAIHNAAYPNSPWSYDGPAPISPVFVVAGTYVGNGDGQDLEFPAPVTWLRIRAVTGDTGGSWWGSPFLGAHRNAAQSPVPGAPIHAVEDPDFAGGSGEDIQQAQYILRIAGSDAQQNALGVTYQYVGICDPGGRFLHAGAFVEAASVPTTIYMPNEDFLAECMWLINEVIGTTTTAALYYKGPGHGTQTAQQIHAAEVASYLELGTGSFTIHNTALLQSAANGQGSYVAMRRDDGSGDEGVGRVLQVYSYVGNGGASRTIEYATGLGAIASGRRPLFALVLPHNGQGYYRDPSHAGTNSSQMGGANSATAITGGGIDQLTIGSTINANGIAYDVFIIPGEVADAGNGWSGNPAGGVLIPVEADSPVDGGWEADPSDPDATFPPVDEGGEVPVLEGELLGMDTDVLTACLPYTTRICNLALSHLGISKQIGDVSTEASEAAAVARLHYALDVETVLADFPWPFATRYASLVLVGGTATVPYNKDWIYAYRAPARMVRARRLLVRTYEGRGFNPDPIEFRKGQDTTGDLILSNEAIPTDGTLVVEYTARIDCPARYGDAQFREVLSWKLAASMAPAISRDSDKAKECLRVYEFWRLNAQADAANEQQQDPEGDAPWITGR